MDARTIETLYGLGHWLLSQERAVDAKEAFHLMLLVAPDDERAWLGLGVCHEKRGDKQTALTIYEMALRALRVAPRCALARARMLRALDDEVAAEEAYEDAIDAADRAGATDIEELARCEKAAA